MQRLTAQFMAARDTFHVANKLKAIDSVRSWHCKFSRVHDDYSTNDIKQYILESSVGSVIVNMLPRREGIAISKHLVVPYDDKDKVMQPGFWPKGIRISGWYFAR